MIGFCTNHGFQLLVIIVPHGQDQSSKSHMAACWVLFVITAVSLTGAVNNISHGQAIHTFIVVYVSRLLMAHAGAKRRKFQCKAINGTPNQSPYRPQSVG